MLEQYLVFTDLDGTLLDHHSYSFEPAVAMLMKLKQAKIPVIPTTSKTFAELLQIRQSAELTGPFIVENGAAVFIPEHYFEEQPAQTEYHQGYWVKSFSAPRQHWLSLLEQHASKYKSAYKGFSQMSTQELSDATNLPLTDAHLANTRLYSEPLQWLGNEQQKQEFSQLMRAAGANVLQGGRFVHISGKCNKGLAMQWLTGLFAQHQTHHKVTNIALGDSFNDNDMLEIADIAVQIKSPKHDYPQLTRTDKLWQSKYEGPTGWSECLQQILNL